MHDLPVIGRSGRPHRRNAAVRLTSRAGGSRLNECVGGASRIHYEDDGDCLPSRFASLTSIEDLSREVILAHLTPGKPAMTASWSAVRQWINEGGSW